MKAYRVVRGEEMGVPNANWLVVDENNEIVGEGALRVLGFPSKEHADHWKCRLDTARYGFIEQEGETFLAVYHPGAIEVTRQSGFPTYSSAYIWLENEDKHKENRA